jgi:RNA polymerase sigma-70 factor (ECF subfamily)
VADSRDDTDEQTTTLALAGARGDRTALEAWVRATQADVWRFLAHLTNVRLADDLTQETYLRAFTSLPRFAGRSSSRTWLLSIARRVVVDHIRSTNARPRQAMLQDDHSTVEHGERDIHPAARFEGMVELELMLAELDPERREALVLTQYLGMSYAEAAEVCGLPVGTIRSRIARAREDLLRAREENDDAM